MAHHLLSVWFDEPDDDQDLDDPEVRRQLARTGALVDAMQEAGAWVFHAGLEPAASATVVRGAGAGVSMTDGPYAETKEQMAGFWIVDVDDLDAALGWAARATEACGRPVEVRPMQA